MKKLKIYAAIGISILIFYMPSTSMANKEKETRAVMAANAWITLIDQGKYDESWMTAALYFKKAITKQNWKQTLSAVRKPLGKLVSREIKGKMYTTSLPGAPDGEYVVIQFATSFEHKLSAIETVTSMLDKDGQWSVSGYYIK